MVGTKHYFQFLVEVLGSLDGAVEAMWDLVEGRGRALPPAKARGCLYPCNVKTMYEPFYTNYVCYSHYRPKLVYRRSTEQWKKARDKVRLYGPSIVFSERGHCRFATEAPEAIVFAYPIYVHRLESLFPLWRLQRLRVAEKLYRALGGR